MSALYWGSVRPAMINFPTILYILHTHMHACMQVFYSVSQNPYHDENIQSLVLQVIVNMCQWHVQRCCQHSKLGGLQSFRSVASKCVWVGDDLCTNCFKIWCLNLNHKPVLSNAIHTGVFQKFKWGQKDRFPLLKTLLCIITLQSN